MAEIRVSRHELFSAQWYTPEEKMREAGWDGEPYAQHAQLDGSILIRWMPLPKVIRVEEEPVLWPPGAWRG